MKKHLNTQSVANELRGSSLFFQTPAAAPSPISVPPPSGERAAATEDQRPSRTGRTARSPRAPDRPRRRVTRRHAFDIYDDQLAALRRRSLQDRLSGGAGSMSQMVREAIDRFIREAEGTGSD